MSSHRDVWLGTFRTSLDIRLESADASKFLGSRAGLPRPLALRQKPNLWKRINMICPVQSSAQKDSASRLTQIKTISIDVPAHRGARAFYTPRAAAGASGARHSLRPLIGEGGK
jgi:hypothetical protein